MLIVEYVLMFYLEWVLLTSWIYPFYSSDLKFNNVILTHFSYYLRFLNDQIFNT